MREVYDDPIAILCEIAVLIWFLKKRSQLLVSVSFFDSFNVLDRWHYDCCVVLFSTPLQISPQNSRVAADGVMSKAAVPH